MTNMKAKMTNWEKGKEGEDFVEKYCLENNIPFEKCSEANDRYHGVDCILDGKQTDIKNTNDIFFMNFKKGDEGDKLSKFLIRHPFIPQSTKATHYCFVDSRNNMITHVEIKQHLVSTYFKSESAYEKFCKDLTLLHHKTRVESAITKNYVSNAQTYYRLKLDWLKLVKDGVSIVYNEEGEEVSFKLVSPIKPSSTFSATAFKKQLALKEKDKTKSDGGHHNQIELEL